MKKASLILEIIPRVQVNYPILNRTGLPLLAAPLKPGKVKGTFYFLRMYQRPITPVVLGIPALELLFELRKGFTPENRRFPIGAI
jgi:hypothetical protein